MKIQIPTNCPECGSILEIVNDQLFCRNKECPAQLTASVEHFAKALNIKGLGEKTIQKLHLSDITELFLLDKDTLEEYLGSEKIASKLYEEIQKARNAPLDAILVSFGIPLIGNTAAKKIVSVISNIDEITPEKCKEAGLGEKATTNLITWLNTEFVEMREFLPFNFTMDKAVSTANKGKNICITGKLNSFKTKAEAAKLLEDLGFTVTDNITKTTNYLVDEENKGSSKRKKAEEYKITIIDNLIKFLG